MVMALRNLTFLIQDNKTLKEMEEDLGGILTMVKKTYSFRWTTQKSW